MCIEEPSVLEAASGGSKFISQEGNGFTTFSSDNIMIGQLQLLDCEPNATISILLANKQEIMTQVNQECPTLVARGGGVTDIRPKLIKAPQGIQNPNPSGVGFCNLPQEMVVLELFVDVCDCMGANVVNTITENISSYIENLTQARVGLKILSNLCTQRMVYTKFSVPVDKMAYKNLPGDQVAKKILESYRFAQLDPFRATTHNKGIMNGIDAVALALGQDWRSIEASCHAFAAIRGHY